MTRRFALIGTGARAEMFVQAVTAQDGAALVAFSDTNPHRIRVHNQWLQAAGHSCVPGYPAGELAAMLARERVDVLIVTSVDATHAGHVVTALEAGCDVITEKPMTVDTAGCRAVLDAIERTGRQVSVAFNYRFNPLHEQVRTLLAQGAVGEIGSVHFEWLLDVRHGADYFRRWHRDKANSGGLLVHKAGHHFDLVNWWLGAAPEEVYASGRLFFYGPDGGTRHGYARDYQRGHDSPAAADDPFALHLADNPRLRALYLDAEQHDGYRRDVNVFAPGVSIEDDMAVLVRYDTGATMTYHLTAYSPWEGYRLMVNGSRGRLELEVVENDHVSRTAAGELKGAAVHGMTENPEQGHRSLTLRRFWEPPRRIELSPYEKGGHGGADARMTAVLLGAATDPMDRSATARDGALALLTGLAANESLRTGRPVPVKDLLDISATKG
ncbi:Gfo/Idh/MocA family protein [Actinoplanes sp. N902-109]|uniref:Gfo/Idh/MocA family protein n=1 Tax=Actinoplanes sp. (strain N902-109) TaxID=649831 RepID=UPI0003294268|nr:Gfo/Idh/MocA family oxidoreductase [Actinoplanes sp. N902-109]AGL17298.1 oxidoreductase domain-containing protein [Actinoplanes sp. N902-109]